MKKILEKFKLFWVSFPKIWIIVFIIAIIVGIITNLMTGNIDISIAHGGLSIIVLAFLHSIFLIGRQLWWYISNSGDYENKNKKK